MCTPKDELPRERLVRNLFLVIAIPFMLAAMVLSAICYGRLFSIGPDDPLSLTHLVGFTLGQVLGILVGLTVGGWAWAVIGRAVFHFSRSDVEGLLVKGPQIPIVSKYNTWCVNLLFRSTEERK